MLPSLALIWFRTFSTVARELIFNLLLLPLLVSSPQTLKEPVFTVPSTCTIHPLETVTGLEQTTNCGQTAAQHNN